MNPNDIASHPRTAATRSVFGAALLKLLEIFLRIAGMGLGVIMLNRGLTTTGSGYDFNSVATRFSGAAHPRTTSAASRWLRRASKLRHFTWRLWDLPQLCGIPVRRWDPEAPTALAMHRA